jgi:hypothetical protein
MWNEATVSTLQHSACSKSSKAKNNENEISKREGK